MIEEHKLEKAAALERAVSLVSKAEVLLYERVSVYLCFKDFEVNVYGMLDFIEDRGVFTITADENFIEFTPTMIMAVDQDKNAEFNADPYEWIITLDMYEIVHSARGAARATAT